MEVTINKKNLQFLSNSHETLPYELVILTKFHEDRTKIVNFLLIVTFLASPKFPQTPSTYKLCAKVIA